MYTRLCIYSHCCCCCAARVRFGALYYFQASAASSCSAVILLCISGFGVVRWCLDIELSVSAWYHKTRRALLRARRLLLLLLLTAEGNERWLAVCGTTFKLASNGAEKQNNDSAAPKTPPLEKNIFIVLEIPCTLLLAAKNTNGYTSDMPSMQPTEHPRTSPPD